MNWLKASFQAVCLLAISWYFRNNQKRAFTKFCIVSKPLDCNLFLLVCKPLVYKLSNFVSLQLQIQNNQQDCSNGNNTQFVERLSVGLIVSLFISSISLPHQDEPLQLHVSLNKSRVTVTIPGWASTTPGWTLEWTSVTPQWALLKVLPTIKK